MADHGSNEHRPIAPPRPREKLKVIETVHGPIIKRKGNKGLALRWVSQDTSFDSLAALLDLNRAKSCEEARASLKDFSGPALNMVYADMEGNIGYQAGAKLPIRSKGDGTIPYHGQEGDCEWKGYIPFEEMPTAFNPEGGWLATANNKVVSDGYKHLITRCWEAPYRQGRISELLETKDKLSLEDMRSIQADAFTYPGRRYATMVVKAAKGKTLEPAMAEAISRLAKWDHQAGADSPAMTIYFFGWRHMVDLLLRHRLGGSLFEDYISSWGNVNLALENILEEKDDFWLPSYLSDYDELLLSSLREGMEEVTRVLKTSDQSQWAWGRVHTLTAFHFLGLFWPLTKIFNVGPVPRDGEGDTVNAAPPESDSLTQVLARGTVGGATDMVLLPNKNSHVAYGGPVCRLIMDLADWDNSRMVLDVGQSGHRLSSHYRDHFEKWCRVEYFPLPYSEEKIEESKESKLRIVPR